MPRKVIKVISFLLCFCLLFQQTGFAQVAGQLDISAHLAGLRNSFIQDKFRPLHLRYLSYDNQANNFRLLLDKGDFEKGLSPKGTVPEEKLKEETKTLLNYFFVGISLPNDSFWVNLRPDSENEVIDPELGRTDVGKILLEADLQLKKDTAKFTSPETLEGKKYWAQLYKKAEELFGYENITIPTLTRPWIVPDEIIIRETSDNAYIYKATLKVMLEQDYLKDSSTYNFKDPRLKALNEYSSQLLRELIIPKLTKDINSSKRYASLRQVYYSLILAQWFKQRFYGKGGLYSWLIDRKNLNGLTSKTPWSKTTYFQAYQKSFKEGEYNLKEPIYTPYGQTIRSYMSGGIALQDTQIAIGPNGAISGKRPFNFFRGFLASILVLGATNIAEPAEVKVALQERPPIEIIAGLAQDNAPKATVQQEEQVEIDKEAEEKVASKKRSEISLISTQLETPEEIELSEIAHIKLEPHIDYKLYRIKNKPIYYVEFASRAVQNSTFDRLSAFVESETYSGRILEDEELKNAIETIETGRLTQGIGHDYKIEDICRFYTQAKNRNVVLNAWEENLKKDLIRLGIIEYRDAIYKPTKKIAVISAAQDIGGLRIDTILHEFRHAIYLTEPFVRESIKKVWDSVDPNQRSKIITAVHVLADYDRKNLDLILNELYASLLDYSSPLSRIVSNNPKGWAPSPEAMSYLFAEFKRIEENRLINGVMGSTFFKNFLEDVNKRLYISKPAATESEPSSSRSTRDSAEPAEVKVALQERPPIEIVTGLAQSNASKATVQQEQQVEIDKEVGEKVKQIFESLKKKIKKETGGEIFLDPQTLERYVGYLNSHFQGSYKALARFMREEERDYRNLLSHRIRPTPPQLETIKTAEETVEDYLHSLGLPYKSIRIVFVSGDRLASKHKVVFGGGLYVPLYHTLVFDASLNAESLFGFLVHEILHANSFVHEPWRLSEGITEYIKIVLLMSKEGQRDFSPRAVFRYSDESKEKLIKRGLTSSFTYQAELLAIAHLVEKIGIEPLLKAYFQGDYSQLKQSLGEDAWRKIEDLARQFGKSGLVTEDYVKGILKILEEVKDKHKERLSNSEKTNLQVQEQVIAAQRWDENIQNLFKNRDTEQLKAIVLKDSKRAAQALSALEKILNEKGLDSQIYFHTCWEIQEIADKKPELISPSILLALTSILEKEGLHSLVYFSASLAIKEIADGSPNLITSPIFSSLQDILKKEGLDPKAYSLITYIIAKIKPELIPSAIISTLETILEKEGLDDWTYSHAAESIKYVSRVRPDLIKPKSLASVVIELPEIILNHPLPHYQLYFNPYFKEKTQRFSEENRYSVGLCVYRLLKRLELEVNDTLTPKAIDFIINKRKELSRKVIFGPGIDVINITHIEEEFSPKEMQSLEEAAGVTPKSITSYKGKDNKQNVLKEIEKKKGPLTIFFNGHGGTKHIWLEFGQVGDSESNNLDNPLAISYQELGDALIARGDLEDVVIIIDACYSYNFSYDFGTYLLNYFKDRGITKFPIIISSGNYKMKSWGQMLNSLKESQQEHKGPVTFQDIFKVEEKAFVAEDLTIFILVKPDELNGFFGKDLPAQRSLKIIEIGFFGRGGQVRTGDLDILGEPADLVIQNVKATDLAISESGINPKTYNIGNYTAEVQIDNTITDIVAFSEDGKVVSINLAKLNAILEKLGVKGNQDALKGFLIHELAEAVALQMGRNQAEAHTAGLMAEAYFVQGNPIARDALAKLWKEREEKYGAWGEKVRPADETPPPADEQRANRILKEKLNTDLKVDGPTTPYSVYRQIYNTKEDPLSGIEHSILFDTFLEIYRKREGLDIKLSDGLKEKLIDNIKRIHRFDRIVTLAISGDLIRELREIIQLASSEEAELWRIYHLRAPSNEIKRTSDDVNVHLGIYSHIDEAISSRAGSIPIKVLDLGCGPVGEAIVGLKKKYGEKIDAYGIDINIEIEKEGVFLRQGDIKEQLSFSDNFFDIIYARVVMDYFTDRELRDGIKKIVRTLKPGGKFVFDTWIRSGGSVYEIILQELAGLADVKLEDGILIIVTKKGSEDEELGKAVKLHSSDPSRPGGIVGSTKDSSLRSESIPPEEKKTGGIDFRGLPIVTQPMQTPLGTVPKNILGSVSFGDRPYKTGTVSNLDEEWSQIERMLNSGIIPSSQRIKEYLERSCSSQDCSERIDRVLSSIADILRLEEERVSATEPALREMLVLLESDKPASAIQTALSKITVLPKEPKSNFR